jgi:hypothetical protein
MKRILNIFYLFFFISFVITQAQINQRKEVRIPDIEGYKTLKCDFHIHTIFSDGQVWPEIRVREAWSEGLDAIAITDHLEYQPNKADVSTNHNRSYEIAKPAADKAGIILIKGAEITRGMPPGHLNLIFVKDAEALVKEDWKETVLEGKKQGAILFRNHPGWRAQEPDGIGKWYPEHTWLEQQDMLMGIEVINDRDYYPEVHNWLNEKKLTFMGNTDIHDPVAWVYNFQLGEHRPMTIVFAKEKTPEAIKEALMEHRTVVYSKNQLIGNEKYLRPIFEKSIHFVSSKVETVGNATCYLWVHNDSDLPFVMQLVSNNDMVQFPQNITIPANKTMMFPVRAARDNVSISETVKAQYEVKNFLTAPDKGTNVTLEFDVNIKPVKK